MREKNLGSFPNMCGQLNSNERTFRCCLDYMQDTAQTQHWLVCPLLLLKQTSFFFFCMHKFATRIWLGVRVSATFPLETPPRRVRQQAVCALFLRNNTCSGWAIWLVIRLGVCSIAV